MPVLDLQMWVNSTDKGPRVMHTFYKKEVASRYTILKRSAINSGTKKSTIFQEGIRRLSHISPDLPWSESVKHMNQWSLCLKESGYTPKERYDAIRGACMRQQEMVRQVQAGEIKSLNRSRQEIIQMKEQKGGLSSSTWYLKGRTSNTIKCQATPNGELAKHLTRNLNQGKGPNDERIKVVEEGGAPATAALRKTDPFRTQQCRFRDPACIVEGSRDCASMACVYEITCASCQVPVDQDISHKETRDPGGQKKTNYIGMTMCSTHSRMKGHLKSQKSKSKHSPMWRHDKESHGGRHQQYYARILTREKSVFPLSLTEGLYIEAQHSGTSLNERNERGRGSLVRITAARTS